MSQTTAPGINRRTVFAGVGAVGALAAVAAVLPAVDQAGATAAQTAAAPPQAAGGYQLTDHVKQYYATARV